MFEDVIGEAKFKTDKDVQDFVKEKAESLRKAQEDLAKKYDLNDE